MGFFSLAYSQKTLAVKNKNRVAFVVSLKIHDILIFFQDGSFQHHFYSKSQQKVIQKGKLNFVPTQIIKSQFKDRVFLKGGKKANNGSMILAFVNISSQKFKPYECLMRTKQDIFQLTRHFVLKCSQKSEHFFIIELISNVQNGLAVVCYDFLNNIWSQMIHMNSKHLNCKYVNTTNQQQNNNKSWNFTLLGNGQKSQSLLYSKFQVEYKHQSNKQHSIDGLIKGDAFELNLQKDWIVKHKFVSMNQLKLFRNFTILGAHPSFKEGNSQFLYVVGNSTSLQTTTQKNQQNLPAIVKINMTSVDQNIPQKIMFQKMSGFKIGKQTIIRQYLGIIDNDMIMQVQNSFKKSIHKIRIPVFFSEVNNKQLTQSKKYANQMIYDQEVQQLCGQFTTKNIQVSIDREALISYTLKCQQFFQRIKESPSVLNIQNYRKINKKVYYNKILQKKSLSEQLNQQFFERVLSLL